ncbi:MAG: ATP-binding protein, partial [Chlorobiales bacterium]|nr:ATP-binding protein [Chlorobiales bacterium]
FDLQKTIESACEALAYTAHDTGLEILCNVPADIPPRIKGDPTRLSQILLNLLSNSVKFTPRGEVELDVFLLSDTLTSSRIGFSIRDTGIGIPDDKRQFIFDMFTQGDTSITRKFGGTGLGLPIAMRLAQLMEGELSFESSLSRGTTFQLTLPLNPVYEQSTSTSPLPDITGKCILLAEPNDRFRTILASYLISLGAIVHSAATGHEAISVASQETISLDMLVLNERQGGNGSLRGVDVVEGIRLKTGRETPTIFLFLTTDGEREKRQCMDIPSSTYLIKPFLPERLLKVMDSLLHPPAELDLIERPIPAVFSRNLRIRRNAEGALGRSPSVGRFFQDSIEKRHA